MSYNFQRFVPKLENAGQKLKIIKKSEWLLFPVNRKWWREAEKHATPTLMMIDGGGLSGILKIRATG